MDKDFIKERISISLKNNKMGKIPSISLPPNKTCGTKMPCSKRCYIQKAIRLYPNVKKAYSRNFNTLKKSTDLYFDCIHTWLLLYKPKYFRWHVGGDIPNQEYLNNMIQLAKVVPLTNFLVFTKKYKFDYTQKPNNLAIILSTWPKYKLPNNKELPLAFVQDGTEYRFHNLKYVRCNNKCDECFICWHLKDSKLNVLFNLH